MQKCYNSSTVNHSSKQTHNFEALRLAQLDGPDCLSIRTSHSKLEPIEFKKADSASIRTASSVLEPGTMTEDISISQWNHSIGSTTSISSMDTEVELQHSHKCRLKEKFQCIYSNVPGQGCPMFLNEIYTELYITESDSGNINKEHEVRQIEIMSRTQTVEIPIKCNDIFRRSHEHSKPARSVLTKGVAGIGKTVSVQKFVMDWAEGRANQEIEFVYPLAFRELNLLKEKQFSLVELLYYFKLETPQGRNLQNYKVLFIFDGLDECRFPLDFQNNERKFDQIERVCLDAVLTNLISGNLLPDALIWITTRPAAASQIPPRYVDLVTEVRGFNNPQKVEYLKKRISDQSLAHRVITHVKSSRSLFIMCHIPVFCWLSATVLERMLGDSDGEEIPKTLTQMYMHFLLIQMKVKNDRYSEKHQADEKGMILKLGKLAFQQLQKGNLIFYEEDLGACDIDLKEAVVYSGVCSQIFREECALTQGKVYCFVHLSIQEFLAAIYVFFMCKVQNLNVLDQKSCTGADSNLDVLYDLHRSAIDRALQSENGHLDLFLRFLMGLSLESNQTLLQSLVRRSFGHNYQSTEATVDYIKKNIEENSSTEKSINLFYCLNELNELSLVKDIQKYLSSERFSKLSLAQWSALVFMLLTSEEKLDVFDLKKYSRSDEGLLRLMLVVKASEIALLDNCGLTERCCKALGSAVSTSSSLRELDLSSNSIGDTGLRLFADGLGNSESKLEKLRLSYCRITPQGCSILASELIPKLPHLKELDLSENSLREAGIQILATKLKNPQCKLEILKLKDCRVTPNGSFALASALRSNPSHLRELDLHWNNPGDEGVEQLVAVMENPVCKLEVLWLSYGLLTQRCCEALASAFRYRSASLKAVDLSGNSIRNAGVELLSAGIRSPHCKLEILRLASCGITEEGAAALANALAANPTTLRELDLSQNHIQDSGLKVLSQAMKNFTCKLQTLRLRESGIMEEGCSALASALISNPTYLRDLNLGINNLTDAGIKTFSAVLKDGRSGIVQLELNQCGLTGECCDVLASTLSKEASCLRELNLGGNNLQDSGVETLCAGLENPHCKLEILRLFNCGVTEKCSTTLASALKDKHTVLRELDLRENNLRDTDIRQISALLENPNCKLEKINLY
ncbi:NACHT, LRR and PYD domains-containing protein 12 isoform X1 [Pygocentrus nattereri]|uniref:NLR family pyrin domain containing 12-like n=1 Tax=Pygocentrus nattereri TaxID=42514 RepID=A0AAR2K409_PYGNA|nr:NACHT, LRR and PYD domains-containing protein 12 isoform X1 [Pygocentrus nattereri]XP_017537262.1 NACHT, LRR and PYD domains-containing protein 12 isoform X1 [Pygocentrus nattereri]